MSFLRRGSPQDNRSTASSPTLGTQGTWEARLNTMALPLTARPYAEFHERALIIGIGNYGADVLDDLCERMDDTNTFKAELRPYLLHIGFNQADTSFRGGARSPNYFARYGDELMSSVVLEESNEIPRANELLRDDWRWLQVFGGSIAVNARLPARIILYRHLMLGENSLLRSTLHAFRMDAQRGGSRPLRHVYIVASALEKGGASVLGDIAALVRATWGENDIPLTAIVCLGSNNNNPEQAVFRAATLVELAHFSATTPSSWRMPGRVRWNDLCEDRTLLEQGAIALLSEPAVSRQQINGLLWGFLTSKGFRFDITTAIRNADATTSRLPTLSFASAHSAIWPTRYLRLALTYQMADETLGPARIPENSTVGYDLSNDRSLELWLDTVRPEGMFPWLMLYTQHHPRSYYLDSLISALHTKKSELQNARRAALDKLEQFVNANVARQTPINAAHWSEYLRHDLEQTSETLTQRIGFIAMSNFLGIGIAPDQRIPLPMAESFEEAFTAIEQILQHFASNLLQREVEQFLPSFEANAAEKNTWLNRLRTWQTQFQNSYLIGGLDSTIYKHILNLDWEQMGLSVQKTTAQDSTFALESMIIPRVPLNNLTLLTDIPASSLRNAVVYPEQRLVFDYFGMNGMANRILSIPYSLQAAITHTEAMRYFARWWKARALERLDFIHQDIRANRWAEAVWTFIRRFERGEFQDQDELMNPPMPEPGSDPTPPAGSEFARQLAVVLERLASSDDDRTIKNRAPY